MPFLSELIGQTVKDAQSQPVGKLTDVIVDVSQAYPFISAIAFRPKHSKEVQFIPWHQMDELEPGRVRLKVPADRLQTRQPKDEVAGSWPLTAEVEVARQLPLAKRILDKQIIDANGRRLVRVNDLKLLRVNGQYRLIGADISTCGILRRLGLGGISAIVAGILGKAMEGCYIAWDAVDALEDSRAALQLKTCYDKSVRMRPAAIVEIVRQPGHQLGANLGGNLESVGGLVEF